MTDGKIGCSARRKGWRSPPEALSGASILVYVETLNRKRQEGEGPDPESADSGWETGNIAAYDYADYEWEALSLDWNISIKKAEEKSFAPYRKEKRGILQRSCLNSRG